MLLNWYIGLIVRPVSTLREIVDARPLGLGLLTLLVVAILNGLVSFAFGLETDTFTDFTDEDINIGPAVIILGTLLFVAYVAVQLGFLSLIVHIISKLFGGNGSYSGMLAGLMMLSILSLILVIPGLLDALASGIGEAAEGDTSPFEVIGIIASIIVGIWSIILGIILIRENYRLSTGMAVLSGIIALFAAIVVVHIILLILLLVVIGVALVVAAS